MTGTPIVRPNFAVFLSVVIIVLFIRMPLTHAETRGGSGLVTFVIEQFAVEGNTIFSNDQLGQVLFPFTGQAKTATTVEDARIAVETYYHQRGYPTALVNIPQQRVSDGIVRLEVIESTIRRVRVKGNRYFTRERLLKEMPAFRPGEVLYLPRVKTQLARVNRNPDLKVVPNLMPGKKLGTIDVEFIVKDKLPLHGFVELNNRSSHDTTDSRLNAMLRYDNLWQKEHSLSFQYQTSPEQMDEVNLVTGTYSLPSPWHDDHLIAIYGLYSDSHTATGEGIHVLGKGYTVGMRYLANLEALDGYLHNLVFGLDYKDFDDKVAETSINVAYLPLYAGYTGIIAGKTGQTQFNISLNFCPRNLGSEEADFQYKRSGARGNYFFSTLSLQRLQKLGKGWHLNTEIGGQMANQPLLSNEQFAAGGVSTVRGYHESEASGDSALYGKIELSAPDIGDKLGIRPSLELTPSIFYDAAMLRTDQPLDGEEGHVGLQGAGISIRGYVAKYIEFRFDWAVALQKTDATEAGAQMFHYKIAVKF